MSSILVGAGRVSQSVVPLRKITSKVRRHVMAEWPLDNLCTRPGNILVGITAGTASFAQFSGV
jgi:hypothetical protein